MSHSFQFPPSKSRVKLQFSPSDEVKAQGYSEKEARLALRATGNSVADATVFAQTRRSEAAKVEEEERERRKKRSK